MSAGRTWFYGMRHDPEFQKLTDEEFYRITLEEMLEDVRKNQDFDVLDI